MAAECGAGNDAVNGGKQVRAHPGRRRPDRLRPARPPRSVPPPLTRGRPGFARDLRLAGAGRRSTAGTFGAQEGAQDCVGVVGHGCLPRSCSCSCRGTDGPDGRPAPALSAAQDHGTRGGRQPGRHGECEGPLPRTGRRRRRRRRARGHDPAPDASGRCARGGVEMVVLADAPAARASHRHGRRRLARDVGAGQGEGEQQNKDPQPRTTTPGAEGGVRCGAHVGSCPRRAHRAHRAGTRTARSA